MCECENESKRLFFMSVVIIQPSIWDHSPQAYLYSQDANKTICNEAERNSLLN